jgi:hypothetical protein
MLSIEIVRACREIVDVLLPGGDRIGPIQSAQTTTGLRPVVSDLNR